MIKPIITAALSMSALLLSTDIQAKTHHMLASCQMADKICNNTQEMRKLAHRAARWTANKKQGSGTFKFFLQADSNDTATEYTFSYWQDNAFFEGPDGRDMSLPVTEVILTKESYLTSSRKQAAKELLSPAYNTRQLIEKNNLPTSDGIHIDSETFCGTSSPNPVTIIAKCTDALEDAGALNAGNISVENVQTNADILTAAANAGINTPVIYVNGTASRQISLESAKKITASMGSSQMFKTPQGYRVTLRPDALTGKIEVTRFKIPPDIVLPIEDGRISIDKVNKLAAKGEYSFNQDSKRFVEYMAARTRLAQWRHLAKLLDDGFDCPLCRVTVRDLPEQKE